MQQNHLDRLVNQARSFLTRWRVQRELRQAGSIALLWLFVGPLVLFLVHWIRTLTQGAQPPVNLWLLIAAALAGPLAYVLYKMVVAYQHYQPGRHTGLALFDAQLSSHDRLVTADEFLGEDRARAGASGAFMQAAVDDAESFVQRAMQTELDSLPMPEWRVRPVSAFGALGAVVIALLLIFGLGGVTTGKRDINKDTLAAALEADSNPGADNEQRLAMRRDPRKPRDPEQEAATAAQPQEASAARQQRTNKEEAAQGQSNAGSSSATQSSSNSSNAAGQPSSEKNASKPKPEEEQQPDTKRPDKPPKKTERPLQKNVKMAMESSAGQGKSSGSKSTMSQFESPEQQDKANPGSKSEDQGLDSEDEDEEEKSSSAVKPDLRDRKAPVDRNMSPMPTGTDPSDSANGRSGPGTRKKTRGVPSMILGIPVADRVQGKPSPGRSKVTQENAKPTAESHPGLVAQERLARAEAAGQVQQWQLLPWMQDLVRNYFMNVYEQQNGSERSHSPTSSN